MRSLEAGRPNFGHQVDLLTLRITPLPQERDAFVEGLKAAGAEFGFTVTRARIQGNIGRAPHLSVELERRDGVSFEIEADLTQARFVGLYVKGGVLRYAAEVPQDLVEMLLEPVIVVAAETKLGAPLQLPGRS